MVLLKIDSYSTFFGMSLLSFLVVGCGNPSDSKANQTPGYHLPENISVETDVFRIGPKIFSQLASSEALSEWSKSTLDLVYDSINNLPSEFRNDKIYNVLIFNLENDHSKTLNEVVFSASVDFQGKRFALWAMGSGEFTNLGFGGYQNWAMKGWFTRDVIDESYVITFTQPKS